MKDWNLLRGINEIDDELILEAETLRFPRQRWGAMLALAACLALVIAVPLLLPSFRTATEAAPGTAEADACGTPLSPYLVPDGGIVFHRYSGSGWESTALDEEASQTLADLMYEGEDIDDMGEMPATVPSEVLDFRNGTYVILYGLDTAVIKTYETVCAVPPVFAEDLPDAEPESVLRRKIPGLDDAVELALALSDGANLGGLRPGMTKEEVTALMGEPVLIKEDLNEWFYGSYYVHFRGFDETVHSVTTGGGCQLTLDSGIGLGSTEEAVLAAYPNHILGDGAGTVNYHVSLGSDELMIETTGGVVTLIHLYNTGDPVLESLTVDAITLYTVEKHGWATVNVIDKAAKRICTTMTISEPEPADLPEEDPLAWMDFGNGTAVGLFEGDLAGVYRYEGAFDPGASEQWRLVLFGEFPGLEDAFQQALENPTETWEG